MPLLNNLRSSKLLRYLALYTALTTTPLITSCSKDNPTIPEEDVPPINPEFTLEDSVQDISNETFQYNSETGNLTIQDPNLQEGDILLAGITQETPQGLLRRVTHIQGDNITTEPATLNDAVEVCDLTTSFQLTPQDKSLQKDGFNFNIPIQRTVLYDADGNQSTQDDQIYLTGNLAFNFDVTNFSIKANEFTLEEFIFNTTTDESINLNLTSDTNAEDLSGRVDLAPPITCTPITVGPLVLVPRVHFYGSLDGDISVTNAQANQAANITTTLSYTGTWDSEADFTNEFNFQTPTFTNTSNLRLRVGPEIEFLAYDIVGATTGVNGSLRAEVTPTQDPWWSLYLGLNATIGARIQAFGWPIANYTTDVITLEELIAQADPLPNLPPEEPTFPNPENNTTDVELDTYIAWACIDPEEDPLTYDVYFGTQENPTQLIADDISNNYFNLPTLDFLTQYYWKVVASDAENSTSGPVWTFTTIPEQGEDKIVFASYLTGDYDLYTMNLDGTELTPLLTLPGSEERTPTCSPDGTKIAFASDLNGGGIYTINRDGTNLQRIVDSGSAPNYSPDGNKIVFTHNSPGSNLKIMDANGENVTSISTAGIYANFPTWIDDEHIIFSGTTAPELPAPLYSIKADGSEPPVLLGGQGKTNRPSVSTDRNQVAFQSWYAGQFTLYQMNLSTTQITPFTTTASNPTDPHWTSSQEGIVYESRETGAPNIYYLDLSNNQETQLTTTSWNTEATILPPE